MALGEVPESKLSDEVVRRDWDLYSEVAMTSSGGEKRHGEVVVFGNSEASVSPLRIGHAVTRDFIDAEGVRSALRSAGLRFNDGLPDEQDLDLLWPRHAFLDLALHGREVVRLTELLHRAGLLPARNQDERLAVQVRRRHLRAEAARRETRRLGHRPQKAGDLVAPSLRRF